MRQAILDLMSDGAGWRLKDIYRALHSHAGESEVSKAIRSLLAKGELRRVRHGVYIRAGAYDWANQMKTADATPAVNGAIISVLGQPRSPDEIAALLDVKTTVVWHSLSQLVQAGTVVPLEPLGLNVQQRFLLAERLGSSATPTAADTQSGHAFESLRPGLVYSAHELATTLSISTKAAREMVTAETLCGRVRAFTYADSVLFYSRMPSEAGATGVDLRPINLHAELGLDGVAVLHLLSEQPEGRLTTSILSDVFAQQTGRPRHSVARILTKLRRAGLLSSSDSNGEQVWLLTELGQDIQTFLTGTPRVPLATPHASSAVYQQALFDTADSAVVKLARFLTRNSVFHRTRNRAKIPINKQMLCVSLNISNGHLDRCLRTLKPFGVHYARGEITVDDPDHLASLLNSF